MKTKTIILSSAGLRNVILNTSNEGSEFLFISGEKQFSMNHIFAEFLSPIVSYYHHSDPTINSINIDSICNSLDTSYQFDQEIFSDEIIDLLQELSRGFSITINEEQSFKLRFLSIILGNEELYSIINEVFPTNLDESNPNLYLQNLQCLYNYPQMLKDYTYSEIIDFLSKHFYLLDQSELMKLEKSTLYSIISNDHLIIENEDTLFDFINQFFSQNNHERDKNDTNDEINIAQFYEKVNFLELSENKLREFINNFDINELTNELWRNFHRFLLSNKTSSESSNQSRYFRKDKRIDYDDNSENKFKGIIHYLTVKCGGNVDEKKSVKVTSSSTYGDRYPKYVVDLEDDKHFFTSDCSQNSWLKFDFIDKKVRPNKYSIRTRPDSGQGGNNLKNWVIEASNTDWGDDWKVLDSRSEVTLLDSAGASCTFDISCQLGEDEYFRYLRIRQTGKNSYGSYFLNLSALEYFGSLL